MDARSYEMHAGRRERIRQRVRQEGIASLKPHEIIEFLLYYAVPRQDVNGAAHALIQRFGSVGGVLRAQTSELTACGISRHAAEWLCLVGEAMLAFDAVGNEDDTCITTFFQVFRYACRLYRQMPSPASIQLCLDAAGRVIHQQEITPSRSWGEPIVLREALIDVMCTKARSALILQFTGRENPEPDEYDFDAAIRYSDALYAARCDLTDVVLVGDSGSASLRQMGKIPERIRTPERSERRAVYLREMPDAATLGLRAYMESLDALSGE